MASSHEGYGGVDEYSSGGLCGYWWFDVCAVRAFDDMVCGPESVDLAGSGRCELHILDYGGPGADIYETDIPVSVSVSFSLENRFGLKSPFAWRILL